MSVSDIVTQTPEAIAPLPQEEWPNVENLVTEDEKPVDNMFSDKEQRLLTESLYSSWAGPGEGRTFLAAANVGMFYSVKQPPLVPDVLLSLDVELPADLQLKRNRSYFFWEYGKPPDAVIEIVSNREGDEATRKLRMYERLNVPYYVIHDPFRQLGDERLRIYEWTARGYVALTEAWLPKVGLGLRLWQGLYEDLEDEWLRWCDREGHLVLTGAERAHQEQQRAEQEYQRAEQERLRAEQEHQRAERMAAKLRELGIEP